MATSSPELEPDPAWYPIHTEYDLQRFLKEIFLGFVNCVNPSDVLMDILVESDIFTETDLESVDGLGAHHSKAKARTVWHMLHNKPVEKFASKILPLLCRHYPHIMPERWTCYDGNTVETPYCLRHILMDKIRPETMADKLFEVDCITREQHITMIDRKQDRNTRWFKLLRAASENLDPRGVSSAAKEIQAVLNRVEQPVPDNLKDLVSQGFPCTCNRGPDILPPSLPTISREAKVREWKTSEEVDPLTTEDDASSNYPEYVSDDEEDRAFSESVVSSLRANCLVPENARIERKELPKDVHTSIDIHTWGQQEGLSSDVISLLMANQIKTVEDFYYVPSAEILDTLQKSEVLTPTDLVALQTSLSNLHDGSSKARSSVYRTERQSSRTKQQEGRGLAGALSVMGVALHRALEPVGNGISLGTKLAVHLVSDMFQQNKY